MAAGSDDRDRGLSGTLFLVGAALSFSLAALTVKLLDRPLGSPQLVFLRSSFMVVVVGAWAMARREPVMLVRHEQAWLFWLRGVLGTVGFLLFFGALRRIPLGDTVILFQAHPLVVALLGPVFLKERLTRKQWPFVVTSILGVGLVVGISGEGEHIGRLMALGCAVTTGVALVLVRILRHSVPTLTVSLAFPIVATVVVGPALALGFAGFEWIEPGAHDWALVAGLALFGTAGQVLLTLGLGRVPAARGAAIANLQVVFAVLFGVTVLGERPTWPSLAGAAIIVGSLTALTILRHDERPKGQRQRQGA